MARGQLISDFERDVMRIGYAVGAKASTIARYIGRTRVSVHNALTAMIEDGTIFDVPPPGVTDRIGDDIRKFHLALIAIGAVRP